MGTFSSDRAIGEYADQIWQAQPVSLAEPEERRGTDRRAQCDQAQPTAAL
jgi:hypothetical protein